MNYFIDIDGTLTTVPTKPWGDVIPDRVAAVKMMIHRGDTVVLWTGGGAVYAKAFAKKHGLDCLCIGKPDMIIDDNPKLRPCFEHTLVSGPEVLDR